MGPSLKKYEFDIKIPELSINYNLDALFGKPKVNLPKIKKVIFNDPATIVIWCDNTKTVVKAGDELFDPEKGLAMAISKKALGNEGNYFNEFKKWLPEDYEEIACENTHTNSIVILGLLRQLSDMDAMCEKAYNALVNDRDVDAAIDILGNILNN